MVESKPKKLLFMHIAKTAGSFVNSIFEQSLGEQACVTHGEIRFRDLENFKSLAEDDSIRFLSGHIYLSRLKRFAQTTDQEFFKFVVLRSPLEHLVSHILWLDHYNLPGMERQKRNLGPATGSLVEEIGRTDLSDPRDLDYLLTNLDEEGIRLLDNCQSRYFATNLSDGFQSNTPASLALSFDLIEAMSWFDLILFQDTLRSDLFKLEQLVGVKLQIPETRINSAQSERRIPIESPLIRQILMKRSIVDSWLYRTARQRSQNITTKLED